MFSSDDEQKKNWEALPSGGASFEEEIRPGRYRAAKQAAIRTEFDRMSEKLGAVASGSVIEVLEARRNDQSGQMRVRLNEGWTSTYSRHGTKLLEPVDPGTPLTPNNGMVPLHLMRIKDQSSKPGAASLSSSTSPTARESSGSGSDSSGGGGGEKTMAKPSGKASAIKRRMSLQSGGAKKLEAEVTAAREAMQASGIVLNTAADGSLPTAPPDVSPWGLSAGEEEQEEQEEIVEHQQEVSEMSSRHSAEQAQLFARNEKRRAHVLRAQQVITQNIGSLYCRPSP